MGVRSLFIAGGLFLIAVNAFAGPKEEVAAATAKWGETLAQNDPEKVVSLYATDAVLWGTLSPTVRADGFRSPRTRRGAGIVRRVWRARHRRARARPPPPWLERFCWKS